MPGSGLINVFLIAMTSIGQSWIGTMNISWKGRQKLLHGTDSRTLIRILKQEEERSFHPNLGKRKVNRPLPSC